MQITNTSKRYGLMAISLHWFMAFLIIVLLASGLYMTRIPIGILKLKLYGWHKELGFLVLWLVMFRLGWRVSNITPSLAQLPNWERIAARTVHWLFYFFMFALPISGWLITSAAGLPVSFFGWFIIPNIISASEEQRLFFQEVHEWLSYGLIITFIGHTGAALKHEFINKDDILRRMF